MKTLGQCHYSLHTAIMDVYSYDHEIILFRMCLSPPAVLSEMSVTDNVII